MKASPLVAVALTIAFAVPPAPTVIAQRQPIAQMIRIEGAVDLKPVGQALYRPAKVDELLFHGDLLRAARGARGVIRCFTDSTTWTVPADYLPRGVANTCSPSSRR
jgi:hypothetical protein